MCQCPNKLDDGTLVGCRKCWQCTERYVDDWVGRCIAESKTALRTFSISLTYGRDELGNTDHERAALLTYSDVQNYFKRLRAAGYVVRYLAVGEYGSKKGRAHWHAVLFFYDNSAVIARRIAKNRKSKKQRPIPAGSVPEYELSVRLEGRLEEVRFMERHWQHGWSCWEELKDGYEHSAAKAVRYVCKYITKDVSEMERQGHFSMSKKPPLGAAYFRQLAEAYMPHRLAPQDLFYHFPGVNDAEGRPKQFLLATGSASADLFCAHYLSSWYAAHGGHPPVSPVLEEYEDRHAGKPLCWAVQRLYPPNLDLKWQRHVSSVPNPGDNIPPGGSVPTFSERHNCFYSETPAGRLWFSTDSEGDLQWHAKINPGAKPVQKAPTTPALRFRDLKG